MMENLKGQRIDDPPEKDQALRYRLHIAVRKYPVQIAVAIALLLLLIPVVMLLNSNSDLRKSNRALREAVVRQQINRKATLDQFCRVINTNAATSNTQTEYIKGLILGGVRSSRAFEHVFRDLGLPPYKERLKQARIQAQGLARLKLPPLDCTALRSKADQQIQELLDRTGGGAYIEGLDWHGRT